MKLNKGRTVESVVSPLTRMRGELEIIKEQATIKINEATCDVEQAMARRDILIKRAQDKFAKTKKIAEARQAAAEKEIADADQWLEQLPHAPNP